MNIELEFDIGDPIFGVDHGSRMPEIIKGTLAYVTIDDKGVTYSIAEDGTDFVTDFEGIDVTSDYCVALALKDNYMKQYKEATRKYLKEQIVLMENNLESFRTELQKLEKE